MSDANFYRAFEDRYRGSRGLIKSRLTVYLPFVLPLKPINTICKCIDLGCGRGEWIELMQENGIDVLGIDLDQGMLDAARKRGLNVILGDAIKYLQAQSSESQTVISGFHLAEHLPFEQLQTLIQESMRVLKPGGLLILETPNSENVVVGTSNFYFDPTHHRPIPSQLLSFMAEYAGFERVKVLRLQEPDGIAGNKSLTLLNVLNGVSPDYAVVAQKGGDPEYISALATAFEIDYGFSLEILASNYDSQVNAKAKLTEATAQQAEAKAQQAEAKAQQAEAKAQQAEAKAQQAEAIAQQAEAKAQQAEAKAQQAEAKAQQAEAIAQHAVIRAQHSDALAQNAESKALHAEATMNALFSSTSWRLTAPLRMISRVVRRLLRLPNATKSGIKLLLTHAKLYINRRPKLKRVALVVLARFPSLKRGIPVKQAENSTTEIVNLSPRAHRVFDELKSAINTRGKGKH